MGNQSTSDNYIRRLLYLRICIGILILGIGLYFASDWVFQSLDTTKLLPDLELMKPNTALAFILSGLSLVIFQNKNPLLKLFLLFLIIGITLIAWVTLFEYIFKFDSDMDYLLFNLAGQKEFYPANIRMSPLAALSFIFISTAFFIKLFTNFKFVSQFLMIILILISFLTFLGYMYDANSLKEFTPYTRMSLYTAITFLSVSFGIFLLDPDYGLINFLSSNLSGSVVARRTLPLLIIIPVILGGLRTYGQTAGYYDTEFGIAIFTMCNIILFVGVVFLNAWLLNNEERKSRKLTEDIVRSSVYIKAIFEHVGEGIITINENSIIESINSKGLEIFGYRLDEILNKDLTVLMPPAYKEKHKAGIKRYKESGDPHVIGKGAVELEGLHKDGTTFPIELSITESYVNGRTIFTGLVRDITERKKVDNMKNEFISLVSHELRTPLTSIHGALAILLEGKVESRENTNKLLTIAKQNSERLIRLINDILDIEKIEAGKVTLKFKVIDLISVVEEAVRENHSYAAKFGISIELIDKQTAYVNVDRDRLLQVLANLISNAIKFAFMKSIVKISIAHDFAKVKVAITNSGKGIPPEFRDKIFKKFTQLDSSSSRTRGGTGLGLNISKEIIEKLNGTINFVSEPDKKTTFYFELPIAHR